MVKNIPEVFNDQVMLKIHFSKFGKVTRLYHNAAKSGAIVSYADRVRMRGGARGEHVRAQHASAVFSPIEDSTQN